jgi:translation initiation factor 5
MNMSDPTDPYYRYKMHPVTITQSGNLYKINLVQIAKDLNRPPKLLIKFIKSTLGINLILKGDEVTTTSNNNASVYQQKIMLFINKYVLCKKCGNPETAPPDSKSMSKCKACSYNNNFTMIL